MCSACIEPSHRAKNQHGIPSEPCLVFLDSLRIRQARLRRVRLARRRTARPIVWTSYGTTSGSSQTSTRRMPKTYKHQHTRSRQYGHKSLGVSTDLNLSKPEFERPTKQSAALWPSPKPAIASRNPPRPPSSRNSACDGLRSHEECQ